jgi:type II secretory pathway pseudopilin PulG
MCTQLRTLFPGVFNSTKNLVFARQVAMQYHRYSRAHRRSSKEIILNQKLARSSRTSQRLREPVDNRRVSSSRSSPYDSPQRPKSRDTGNTPSCLSSFSQDQDPQVPGGESTTTNRDLDRSIRTTNSTWSPNSIRSMSYIHGFLQNCSPPLNHILSRFIDLGFRSPDTLSEVAHKWTMEERRDLMKRLGPGPDGNKMTELELAALERGFQAFRCGR